MAISENFDWVKERAACSLYQMFKKLQMGVSADVKSRTELSPITKSRQVYTLINGKGNRFSVTHEDFSSHPDIPITRSVDFALFNDAISVSDEEKSFISVTVTLNGEGSCMYSV